MKVIAYQVKIFTEGITNNDSTGVNIDAKEMLRMKERKERKDRGDRMEKDRIGDWQIMLSPSQRHRLRQVSNPVLNPC